MEVTADKAPGSGLEEGFRIGDLRVDPQAGDVTGTQGREQLDPKVMGVLVMLAESAGKVVSREDLLSKLWPDVVVSDDALTRCLYELRRQMSAAAGSDHYRALIETLPKRGYRLNATITPIIVPPPAAPKRASPWLILAAAVLAAAVALLGYRYFTRSPPMARVAVLPFLDLSATQDQRFLADGVAEEILERLNQSTSLQVISRTSSFAFRDQPIDVTTIGRKLDVTHVLEGSIRTSGARLRVTAQLISTADNSHVWSETYERDRNDVFAVQDDIAIAVARELEARVTGLKERRSTENPDALIQFAQGEYLYYRRSTGDPELAVKAFEQAVALDPGYAQAWAGLAGAYSYIAFLTDPPLAEYQRKQGEAAQRAVSLNPKLGVAHFRLGQYYEELGDSANAKIHYAEAARLEPENPFHLSNLSEAAFARGDNKAAIAYQRRAVAVDPMALVRRGNLALLLQIDGQLEEALAEYQSVRSNDPGANPSLDSDIIRVLVQLHRYAEAEALIAGLPAGSLKDHGLALLYDLPAKRAEAEAALERLAATPPGVATQEGIMDRIRLAEAYAIQGRNNDALDALERTRRALKERTGVNAEFIWYFTFEARLSPLLEPLHADPRWKELVKETG